jgi:hypothetical protein
MVPNGFVSEPLTKFRGYYPNAVELKAAPNAMVELGQFTERSSASSLSTGTPLRPRRAVSYPWLAALFAALAFLALGRTLERGALSRRA